MSNSQAIQTGQQAPGQSRWHVPPGSLASGAAFPAVAVYGADDVRPVIPGLTLWDVWPVQLDDGLIAPVLGGDLWVVLSAPKSSDPDDRHDVARMRLLHRVNGEWRDCGDLLPDMFAPGSREWSGSARLDPASGRVTLWFTAAGHRDDAAVNFDQRLFHAVGQLDLSGPLPCVTGWSGPDRSVTNDGTHYADLSADQGVPGRIKGFRDPYWLRNPADGQGYLVFTGSKPAHSSQSDFDGVIGIARADDADGTGSFTLLPALIDADGTVNELERPHAFVHDGTWYLFWSTQSQQFAPTAPPCPTGLYGMAAPDLFGPWEPLNGSGLVLANPMAEPLQAYAWQVIPGSLDVIAFVDYWGLGGRDKTSDPALKAAQFGGTIAPMVRIELNGKTSRIVAGGA
jgi:levansucrase